MERCWEAELSLLYMGLEGYVGQRNEKKTRQHNVEICARGKRERRSCWIPSYWRGRMSGEPALSAASGGSECLHLLSCILRHHCRHEQ